MDDTATNAKERPPGTDVIHLPQPYHKHFQSHLPPELQEIEKMGHFLLFFPNTVSPPKVQLDQDSIPDHKWKVRSPKQRDDSQQSCSGPSIPYQLHRQAVGWWKEACRQGGYGCLSPTTLILIFSSPSQ